MEVTTQMPKPSCMYTFMRRFARVVVHVFFRNVEILHPENIPEEGPLIVVSNHNNQFVDSAMVMKTVQKRPLRFIIAEKSMHRPVIGQAARAISSIPVIRPQDRAKAGSGVIVDFNEETLIMTGEGTKFTEECTVGFAITIKGCGTLRIENIISDTEMEMFDGHPWIDDFKKKQNKGVESFNYKVTPKVNQHEAYDAVYDALAANSTISIFPEGGSHDNSSLLKLKPGVAVMALGAMSKGAPVQIQAIGINYFAGHQFRSNVVVECGVPFTIDPKYFELYQQGETEAEKKANRRAAYAALMVDVQDALESVTFNAASYRNLTILRTARRLYQGDIELSLEDYIKLYRRFVNGWVEWRNDPEFQKLEDDIDGYLKQAAVMGFTDKQIKDMRQTNSCTTIFNTIGDMLISVFIVIPLAAIALPGIILMSPLLIRIDVVVRREMAKALAGSTVKVKALDVSQSQRVILSIKYYPTLILFYCLLSGLLLGFLWDYEQFTGEWHEPITDNLWWIFPLCTLVLFPLYTYVGVKIIEILVYRFNLFPSQLHVLGESLKVQCSCFRCPNRAKRRKFSLSQTSNLRLRRRNLQVRTQTVIQDLTSEDETWQEDPIITKEQLREQREKETEGVVQFLTSSESMDPASLEAFIQNNGLQDEIV